MKSILATFFALGAHGAQLQASQNETPMAKVVTLLISMKARIESDGKNEQMSYDKYACWCESTLGRKAVDISQAKKDLVSLQELITSLGGDLGSHGAEIENLKKVIAENIASQKEATEVREKERKEYESTTIESEQCIGALEAAIRALTAGTTGFLEVNKQVELMSVVAGVRGALQRPNVAAAMAPKDLDVVRRFIESPADFVNKRTGDQMSAAQTGHNPFGDYAPQSDQISGILRSMYETFAQDVEAGDAEEADSQKSFEELMSTKQRELQSLQQTLKIQEQDDSRKTLKRDESRELLDHTQETLAADEEFFAETKAGCQLKAVQWGTRSRLRTEELQGVNTAIDILTAPESQAVFSRSTTTFFQVAKVSMNAKRLGVSARLAHMAQKFHSFGLASLAVKAKTSGHFDQVIDTIDKMIADVRAEEQDDIAHRDRCQRAQDKNADDKVDLGNAISKADNDLTRLGSDKTKLEAAIRKLNTEIAGTKSDMEQALTMRNTAVRDFRQALKDDTQTVAILEKVLVSLARFYSKNEQPTTEELSLAQKSGPTYSVDEDKAPETSWEGGDYGGRKRENHGIVEIIEMIKEDTQKEIKESHEENDAAQAQYEKERAANQDTLDAQKALKASTEKELLENGEATRERTKFRNAKNKDLQSENTLSTSIHQDCAWVAANFATRRTKRKQEIAGLTEAKGYLSGAEDGSLI